MRKLLSTAMLAGALFTGVTAVAPAAAATPTGATQPVAVMAHAAPDGAITQGWQYIDTFWTLIDCANYARVHLAGFSWVCQPEDGYISLYVWLPWT